MNIINVCGFDLIFDDDDYNDFEGKPLTIKNINGYLYAFYKDDYVHRLILGAADNERVIFLTKNRLDFRRCNIVKVVR